MKIIYCYTFDVTKVYSNKNIVTEILKFMEQGGYTYSELLFDIRTVKMKNETRKSFVEKVIEKEEKLLPFFYVKEAATSSYHVGLSNCLDFTWKKKKLVKQEKAILQLISEVPRTACFKVCLNEINWFRTSVNYKKQDYGEQYYPLSSNIVLHNDYRHKLFITFCFELVEGTEDYLKIIHSFQQYSGLDNVEKGFFVELNETEKKRNKLVDKKIRKEFGAFKITTPEYNEKANSDKISIISSIKKAGKNNGYEYVSGINCLYELRKIDCYCNQQILLFDYDKENKSLGGGFRYQGLTFCHTFQFTDFKGTINNENIGRYLEEVMKQVELFVKKYGQIIYDEYPKPPGWFSFVDFN